VSTSAASRQQGAHRLPRWLIRTPVLLAIFSVFYLLDVCLRAAEKFFWYDEIFTLYFSRLSDFSSLWRALQAGVDFNPPLFYLFTRASLVVFGEGNIAIRLPEILGFLIFCLCLFYFVQRHAGMISGLCALLLPMLTGAYFYAYDARPHAIVLGACGLAMICWQRATESRLINPKWLSGFSLSLLLAFMLHCYALILVSPFAIAEVIETFRLRRVRLQVWLAIVLPAVVSVPLYLVLLRSYGKLNTANSFSNIAVARWNQFPAFYVFLLTPCVLILLSALAVFAASRLFPERLSASDDLVSFAARRDFLLGLAFLVLPLFGIILGKVVHGPSFSRYFLSALAGVCVVIGIGVGQMAKRTWLPGALAVLLTAALGLNFARLLNDRLHGKGEALSEPSMGFALDTTPGKPLAMHGLLTENKGPLPIVVLNALDFVYLVQYDPGLTKQLYFLTTTESDFIYHGFRRFLDCCGMKFNPPVTYQQFVAAHPAYLVYGGPGNLISLGWLEDRGSRIRSLREQNGHFLARFSPGN
jgi:hypothetical protein